MFRVQVDAAATNRSLTNQRPSRPQLKADAPLKMWRRLIDHAAADAKRTYAGLPTDSAILARWWIQEHRPLESDKAEWERSFDCACKWLNLDTAEERTRLITEIDQHLRAACLDYAQNATYVRRAQVLSCAGVPTAIQRALVLPLVSEADYEHVAGLDYDDPPPRQRRPPAVAA